MKKKLKYITEKNGKEEEKEINLENNRYKYTNEEFDFTVIEIIEEDGIIDILEIDKFINSKDYKDEGIFSIQYPRELKIQFIAGKIMDKKNNLFSYSIEMDSVSSGSPILLMANNKVIGLHTDRAKINNIKENLGIPLNLIINTISIPRINKNNNEKIIDAFKEINKTENKISSIMVEIGDSEDIDKIEKLDINYNYIKRLSIREGEYLSCINAIFKSFFKIIFIRII